jgi:hypothetical protein
MPATIIKQMNNKYMVRSSGGIHGRDMTKKNAEKQRNLLNAIHYSEWEPTQKRKKR